jgi:ribosomal protein S11
MFLSPDNYIQAPGNTQNYNRYAYCLNNPLKYTDPSGNITYAAMAGFIHGFTSTSEGKFKAGFMEAGRRVENSLKIWNGLVTYDTHYSGKGDLFRDAWQIVSRLTFEINQTLVGLGYSHLRNISGNIDKVGYFGGATVVDNSKSNEYDGVTLGSYINGRQLYSEINGDENNKLLMHEFGHTLQSRRMGNLYLTKVALPSGTSGFLDYNTNSNHDHDFTWFEIDANIQAYNYLDKRYKSNGKPSIADHWDEDDKNYPRHFRNIDWKWFVVFNPIIPLFYIIP